MHSDGQHIRWCYRDLQEQKPRPRVPQQNNRMKNKRSKGGRSVRKLNKRSPAFQLYVQDWLSSPTITLMSPAQEGAYLRLLLIQWNSTDFALPNDDVKLASLS